MVLICLSAFLATKGSRVVEKKVNETQVLKTVFSHLNSIFRRASTTPGGVIPYMGYIGMCGPKGYGFSAALVINRVSILADFGHFGHK